MDKKELIEILLEKRFGEKIPGNIPCLLEVNAFPPADGDESPVGIGIQLVIKDNIKEEYQVNKDGVVFSWGNTPVIDEKSLKQKFLVKDAE